MIRKLLNRVRRTWTFVLAASSIPLSYLLQLPCSGVGCAFCPGSGGCSLIVPVAVIFMAIIVQSFSRIKKVLTK